MRYHAPHTHLKEGPLLLSVELLMQPLQQESQELLAVVVLAVSKLRRKLVDPGLEAERRHTAETGLHRKEQTAQESARVRVKGSEVFKCVLGVGRVGRSSPHCGLG